MEIQLSVISTVLSLLCCLKVICAQNCSNFIVFTDHVDVRVGRFEIRLDQPLKRDSYVEVKVFVSNHCKIGLCSLAMATDVDNAYDRYRAGRSVPFTIYFRGASKDAWVKGIALAVMDSNVCRIICKHETDTVDRKTKSMKHALYLEGERNFRVSPCNLVKLFSPNPRIPCGVPSTRFTKLAINGTVIQRGSWPWLAAIYHKKNKERQFICGGTIISTRTILTAAHCFFDNGTPRLNEDLSVFLGKHNLTDLNEQRFIQRNPNRISIHHEYRPLSGHYDADIALFILDRDIIYTDYIKPACIWDGADNETLLMGRTGTIVGWGIDETRRISQVPKMVTATTVPHESCSTAIYSRITKRNFCAKDFAHRSSPCGGDSGGGIFIDESEAWKIRGIVSSTIVGDNLLCDTTTTTVYTDVVKFTLWIFSEME